MFGLAVLLAVPWLALGQAPPASGSAPSSADAIVWEAIVFVADRGDSVPAERGRLTVPEDRGRLGGRTIDLTSLRFRSTAARPGAPVVYLAGGPGGSGQLVAKGVRFPVLMRMREAADLIVLDQRGTWGSGDLTCPVASDPLPDSVPGTEENLLASWRRWSAQCVRHWTDRGVDLAAYHSVESADDIESLRRALGVERVSLWGISYGTQLAQAFARRHPERLERMILAGPEPLDRVIKPPSQADGQVERLDSLLAADSLLRARIPRLRALIDSVHRALDQRPVRVVVRGRGGDSTVVGIGRFDVAFLTAFSLGNRAFLRAMPALYLDMAAGNYDGIAPFVLRLRRYNTTAMALTTDCATGADAAGLARARAEAPGSAFGMAANFPFPELCASWPHRDLGPEFRRAIVSAVPTLFVVGTMDGRTPPANVGVLAEGLSNRRTVRIEGASHDDDLVVSHPGIADAMVGFLRGDGIADVVLTLPPWEFTPPRR